MRFNSVLLAVAGALIVFSGSLKAQTPESLRLNHVPGKQKLGLSERTFFELDTKVFEDARFVPGAQLELELETGLLERLVLQKKEEYLPGIISIVATKKGGGGKQLVATFSGNAFNGVYYRGEEDSRYFGFDMAKGKNFVSKTNTGTHLACGVDDNEAWATSSIKKGIDEKVQAKQKERSLSSAAPLFTAVDDSITIDLMIVYTDAAATWSANESGFGDIDGVIAQAMNLSQNALDNSKTGIRLRLVHAHNTSYNEITDGEETTAQVLGRLSQKSDGHMEEVHTLRTQYGADLVSLFANTIDLGGRGHLLAEVEGNTALAFSIAHIKVAATGLTLIHEIGHNMGSHHSITQNLNAAPKTGALFHYSTGYQDFNERFHTVMAYSDGPMMGVPFFSSPNLFFSGRPTGTDNALAPANNARSMKEIKRTVSNYQPTMVNPPVANVSETQYQIVLDQEANRSFPFQISNNGASPLVWDIDFGFVDEVLETREKSSRLKTVGSYSSDQQNGQALNYLRPSIKKAKSVFAEEVLYSTSFESSEGFSTGSFEAHSEWRRLTGQRLTSQRFMISDSNPKSGTQHLRLTGVGNQEKTKIVSPFLGYQPFGAYELTVHFRISGTGVENETFTFALFDGRNSLVSSAVYIDEGLISVEDLLDELNENRVFRTSATVAPNQYAELKIIFDPDNQKIIYRYNGVTIAQTGYLRGFSPGKLEITKTGIVPGSTLDVDDIEIKRVHAPYPWLSVSGLSSGVTFEGGSIATLLTFSTAGLSAGTYQTMMKVRTNDPENPEFQIPITLTVTGGVSSSTQVITGSAGWRLLSLPKTAGTVSDIADDTVIQGITGGTAADAAPNIIIYDDSGLLESPSDVNTAWGDGHGFALYFFDNNRNGSKALPVSLDVSGSEPSSHVFVALNAEVPNNNFYYTLLGNPFASNFDLSTIAQIDPTESNIQNNVFLWDNKKGSYSALDRKAPYIVSPWQGFWVEASGSDANPTSAVIFPTSGKTNADVTGTHFSKEAANQGDIDFTLSSETAYDEAIRLSFREAATPDYDLDDASKLTPLLSQYATMAFKSNGVLKSVESLPWNLAQAVTVPMEETLVGVGGSFTLDWKGLESVPPDWALTLHDYDTGVNEDMRLVSEYTFDAVTSAAAKANPLSILTGPAAVVQKSKGNQTRFAVTITPASASPEGEDKAKEFALEQNYPNPFNPATNISFTLPVASEVTLEVFDMLGQKVATLEKGKKQAGKHSISFDASNLSSGVYMYRLQTPSKIMGRQMVLIK